MTLRLVDEKFLKAVADDARHLADRRRRLDLQRLEWKAAAALAGFRHASPSEQRIIDYLPEARAVLGVVLLDLYARVGK